MRNFFIDLLRGLCILSVMCMHIGLPGWAARYTPNAIKVALASAYYGVTVFFVISGYLIASTSIRRFRSLGDIDVKTFATFRLSRIGPFLLLVLALLCTLRLNRAGGFIFARNQSVADAAASVLSLQFNDWYVSHGSERSATWNVMWSLSIEELFYVFFPIVCRLLRSRAMLVAWILFSLPFCFYTRSLSGSALYQFSGCADALSIGVLVAILTEKQDHDEAAARERTLRAAFGVLGMLGALCAIFAVCHYKHPSANARFGPLLCALSAGVFIYCALLLPRQWLHVSAGSLPRRVLGFPLLPLALLGRSSYEAYLLHMPIKKFTQIYVHKDFDLGLLVLLIGIISYLLNVLFTERLNKAIRSGEFTRLKLGSRNALFRQFGVPALVVLCVLVIPNAVVAKDHKIATGVISVALQVNRDNLHERAAPLIVYGANGDADFLSIKRDENGAIVLQFDHWGSPTRFKTVAPEPSGDTFSVYLDCRARTVSVNGTRVFSSRDLADLSVHDQIAIGINDIGGTTMSKLATSEIAGSVIHLNNGSKSEARVWTLGD